METKVCRICSDEKPLADFPLTTNRNRRGEPYETRRSKCKLCQNKTSKLRYEYSKETGGWGSSARRRADHLLRKFGLTPEEYSALLESQGGGCAVCGKVPGKIPLHVDHDHETGKVRGLLCAPCNWRLGWLENMAWMSKATSYLKR